MWLIPSLTAPSMPPADLEVFPGVLGKSLTVTWKPVPACCSNGVMSGYTVTLQQHNTLIVTEEVSVQRRRFLFRNLTPGNYIVGVSAKTAQGGGPFAIIPVELKLSGEK